jgi:transcriptional regulator with XRE-family HTH domain
MSFAENLRRLRLERFLSQAEVARLAGVHAITVTRLEAGRQAPSTRSVRALAGALGVQPRDLASPQEVAAARMLGRRGRRGDDPAAGARQPSRRSSGGHPNQAG